MTVWTVIQYITVKDFDIGEFFLMFLKEILYGHRGLLFNQKYSKAVILWNIMFLLKILIN